MGAIGLALGSSSGGGAAAFKPTDITGLKLWLKADSLSLNDGDPVSTWTDSSGNSNTASQGTAANKPTYKASIINSLPVVRFDGSNDFMTVTRNAGLEPNNVTIFVAFRATAILAAFGYMVNKPITSGSSISFGIGANSNQYLRVLTQVATTGLVGLGTIGSTISYYDSVPHCLVHKEDGAKLSLYFDGTLLVPGAGQTTAIGNIQYDANNLFVGSYDGTQFFGAFDLAELLVYNTALSDANRWQVQGYLGNRWAIP